MSVKWALKRQFQNVVGRTLEFCIKYLMPVGMDCCCFCCLRIAPRAQLLTKNSWLLHLINDRAPPAARHSSGVARAYICCCYPHTGNGGHSWRLSSCSLSLPVGFSFQDEAMDVARSAPQWTHYHADVIYLLPYLGIKKRARAL